MPTARAAAQNVLAGAAMRVEVGFVLTAKHSAFDCVTYYSIKGAHSMRQQAHRVAIVGGGAGGLELAARLGRQFGPKHIVLIDAVNSHVWKPSLHEVAA